MDTIADKMQKLKRAASEAKAIAGRASKLEASMTGQAHDPLNVGTSAHQDIPGFLMDLHIPDVVEDQPTSESIYSSVDNALKTMWHNKAERKYLSKMKRIESSAGVPTRWGGKDLVLTARPSAKSAKKKCPQYGKFHWEYGQALVTGDFKRAEGLARAVAAEREAQNQMARALGIEAKQLGLLESKAKRESRLRLDGLIFDPKRKVFRYPNMGEKKPA